MSNTDNAWRAGARRPPQQAVHGRPHLHRAARRAAVGRGPDGPVDARRQPDQVAPGAHHVVLRDLRAAPACARLPRLRSRLRVSLQLLLRGRRPAPSAAPARHAHAARRWTRSWPIAGTCRTPWSALLDGEPTGDVDADRRARPASRAAASGADPDGRQASAVAQSAEAGLSRRRGRRATRRRRWRWRDFEGGLVEIGHDGDGFAFDNEGPRHASGWSRSRSRRGRPMRRVSRLHRGRRLPAAGVLAVGRLGLRQPARLGGAALLGAATARLARLHAVGPAAARSAAPVCHVSCFEADAFAKWAGKRLPREAEWEAAPARRRRRGRRGDVVWEWTASPTSPIPAIASRPARSASTTASSWPTRWCCAAAARRRRAGHMRPTYRNFFPPDARWMFGGIRLAEDLR